MYRSASAKLSLSASKIRCSAAARSFRKIPPMSYPSKNPQRHKNNKTLSVGRHFDDAVPAVDCGDGVHPFGTLRGQVRQFQIAATGSDAATILRANSPE